MPPREDAVRCVAQWWAAQLGRDRLSVPGEPWVTRPNPDQLEAFATSLRSSGTLRILEWEDVTPARGAFGRRRAAEAVQRQWVLTWPGPDVVVAVCTAGIVPNIALFPLGIESLLTELEDGHIQAALRSWAGAQTTAHNFGP